MNSTTSKFILALSNSLPSRRIPKTGRHPIPKEVILEELFNLFKYNYGWRNVKHKTICYQYFCEIKRRGLLKKFFTNLTTELNSKRLTKTIIDSSDLVSYKTNNLTKYSGKYHNYCLKMTIEVTDKYIPVNFSLDSGSTSDSKILDKLLSTKEKLPYEVYLDKGYERYDRRRELKKRNCQVRMEMKKGKNRKRGPRFKFTDEQKKLRSEIEKNYGWLKSFMVLRLNRMRLKSNIMAAFLFALNYYTYYKLSL